MIGADRSSGVIGADGQVHGYRGLIITDGAALPANPGVNPSLTITALAERTISQIPATPAPGAAPDAAPAAQPR